LINQQKSKKEVFFMKKRILSLLIAGVMLVSLATTASAAIIADYDELPPAAGITATGSGDFNFIDTLRYNVTLPTSAALNFTLDPQGLSVWNENCDDAETLTGIACVKTPCASPCTLTTLDDLKPYAGSIIFENDAIIINNSSVPVAVSAAFNVVAGGGSGGVVQFNPVGSPFSTANYPQNAADLTNTVGTGVSAIATPFNAANMVTGGKIKEAMAATSVTSMLMFVSPGTNRIATDTNLVSTPSGLGYVIGTSASTLRFVFDAANYDLDLSVATGVDPMSLNADTGDGTRLKLGGYVNPAANWRAFTESAIVPRLAVANEINNWNNANPANSRASGTQLVPGTNTAEGTRALAGADFDVFVASTGPAITEFNAVAANLFAVPKLLEATPGSLLTLVPVSTITSLGAGADLGGGLAIAANTAYRTATPTAIGTTGVTVPAGTFVKSAAISAANNTAARRDSGANAITFRAWGATAEVASDADVIWLPVRYNPGQAGFQVHAALNNSTHRTVSLNAVFRFAQPTAAETAGAARVFTGAARTTEGISPLGHGLLGLSVNALRVISLDGTVPDIGGGGGPTPMTLTITDDSPAGVAAANITGTNWYEVPFTSTGGLTAADVVSATFEVDTGGANALTRDTMGSTGNFNSNFSVADFGSGNLMLSLSNGAGVVSGVAITVIFTYNTGVGGATNTVSMTIGIA
jgi:hypothetical protein